MRHSTVKRYSLRRPHVSSQEHFIAYRTPPSGTARPPLATPRLGAGAELQMASGWWEGGKELQHRARGATEVTTVLWLS